MTFFPDPLKPSKGSDNKTYTVNSVERVKERGFSSGKGNQKKETRLDEACLRFFRHLGNVTK